MGNYLFQYVFWRLMSLRHGRPFADLVNFKFVHDPFELSAVAGARPQMTLEEWDSFGIDMPIGEYMMDFRLYRRHRGLIKTALRPRPHARQYDVAVHVRLDDIFGEQEHYTALPRSFYKRAVANALAETRSERKSASVVLIGRPISRLQYEMIMDVADVISALNDDVRPKIVTYGSVSDDMTTLMSSTSVVASTSTFWFWPCFASNVTTSLHVPMWGQNLVYNFFSNATAKDATGTDPVPWVEFQNDERSRFRIHAYDVALKHKVREEDARSILFNDEEV